METTKKTTLQDALDIDIFRLISLKAQRASIDKEYKEISQQNKDYMNLVGLDKMVGSTHYLQLSHSDRETIAYKAIIADIDQCASITEVRKVLIDMRAKKYSKTTSIDTLNIRVNKEK